MQCPLPLEDQSAENEHPVGIIAESVDVETVACSDFHALSNGSVRIGSSEDPGYFQIDRFGDLQIGPFSLDEIDLMSERLDQRRVVSALGESLMGGTENIGAETLWCLDDSQRCPVDGATIDPPQRVDRRQYRNDPNRSTIDRIDDPLIQVCPRQGSGRIVDQDYTSIDRDRRQAIADRRRTRRAPGDYHHTGHVQTFLFDVGLWYDDHHTTTCLGSNGNRPVDDSSTVQIRVLLGSAEARATAAGDHDAPDVLTAMGSKNGVGGVHGLNAIGSGRCYGSPKRSDLGYDEPVTEIDLLRGVELLDQFDEAEFQQLLDASDTMELSRSDVVFGEGDEPDACYVVVNGRIAIANKSFDGRESMFAIMERGDLFGEMGFFDGMGRSAEARALESSAVIHIPYTVLQTIWEARPDLLWSVVRMLSKRLRSTDQALADAFFLDVTGRTAKHLLELAGEEDSFEIPITQEELAGLVGASRERVNKAIASFLRLGWIEHNGGVYRILKRRELEIRSQ